MHKAPLTTFLFPFVLVAVVSSTVKADDRYGFLDLLDHNSKFNTNFYPEPLNTDEMDADQELRLNWSHTEKRDHRTDDASFELEKNFGPLSLELEAHYSRDVGTDGGVTDRAEGVGPIEVSARYPFVQFVNGAFDYTLGGNLELAIATGTDASKNTEFVAGLYQLIAFGDHFSFQSRVGLSTLYGPGEDGGEQVLEYAGVFGYNIPTTGVVTRVTPIAELDGETGLNHGESGATSLDGVIGANIIFDSIKLGQPKLLLGYEFPLNDTARADFHWGIVMSVLIEY